MTTTGSFARRAHGRRRTALAAALLLPVMALGLPAAALNGPATAPVGGTLDAMSEPTTPPRIVPRPVSVEHDAGAAPFVLDPGARIVAAGEAAAAGDFLAQVLRPSTGYDLPVVAQADEGADIALRVGPEHAVAGFEDSAEAYTLVAGADGVVVAATSAQGVFNGVQTLRQLLPAFIEHDAVTAGPWTVPAVSVVDAPRFEYRGIMLDVARSFQTVDEVKAFVDSLVQLKMNHLHLHLADDQGWRIEITNEGRAEGDDIDYTRLTSVSGQTAMTEQGYRDEPGRTGFYTQEDYAEIVAYAAQRHVVVVPEIDTPGHTQAALHAIPQLNTEGAAPEPDPATGVPPAHGTGEVGHSTLDTRNEVTYTFLEHVWSQIAALTPGPYLHIGGDESHVTEEEDYIYFMERMVDVVEGLGKEPFGWNELALADVHEGNVLQMWSARTAGAAIAPDRVNENGARMVVSDAPHAYLDQRYDGDDPDDPDDPVSPIGLSWACPDDCTVERYYDWDPQELFADVTAAGFLGVEGPLWSETVRGLAQAQWLVLPRAAATLEIGWTPQQDRALEDFFGRLATLGGRLTLQDHNLYATPEVAWTVDAAGIDQRLDGPGTPAEMTVGVVTAPGTSAEEVSATVDLGDGGGPLPATVVATREGDELTVNGEYLVRLEHAFTEPGTYSAVLSVTAPNGTATTPLTVTVLGEVDPTPTPGEPAPTTAPTGPPARPGGGTLPATGAPLGLVLLAVVALVGTGAGLTRRHGRRG